VNLPRREYAVILTGRVDRNGEYFRKSNINSIGIVRSSAKSADLSHTIWAVAGRRVVAVQPMQAVFRSKQRNVLVRTVKMTFLVKKRRTSSFSNDKLEVRQPRLKPSGRVVLMDPKLLCYMGSQGRPDRRQLPVMARYLAIVSKIRAAPSCIA
jgi:hypothetical protein